MSKIIKIIFFTVFLDLLGYGILIPIIPLLFTDPSNAFYLLTSNQSARTGFLILGLLIASYPIGQFFATPILGQLSDKYGRKKILIISILGTSISYIIFAIGIVTKNIPILFISRFFDGITGGNIAVAQATIADVTLPENRAKNFGMIGAAFGLGFIFGPFIGGKLADSSLVSWFTPATPFYFAALLAFINVISIIFFLPETNKHISKEKEITFNKSIANIREALFFPQLRNLFSTSFLFNAGFTFFTTFFSVFLIKKFGYTEGKIGTFFAYVGIWSVITQGLLTRWASKKFTHTQILKVTLLGCSIFLLAYFLPQKSWQLFLVPPFFSVMTGLTMANLNALISKSGKSTSQGEIMGISSSVNALAQSIPPIISGVAAALISPYTPILFASFFIFISWVLFVRYHNGKKTILVNV